MKKNGFNNSLARRWNPLYEIINNLTIQNVYGRKKRYVGQTEAKSLTTTQISIARANAVTNCISLFDLCSTLNEHLMHKKTTTLLTSQKQKDQDSVLIQLNVA